jgi:hypothetical protein
MNERIKELAKEAGLLVYQDPTKEYVPTKLEKFAELIVQECVTNVKDWEKDSRNHISYMLERHFGVDA